MTTGATLLTLLACGAALAAGPAAADSFNWGGPASLVPNGGLRALPSVSCPTSSQCTTVDARGEQMTFDPSSGAISTRTGVDLIGTVSSLSCPGTTQCTAVDNGGNEITFDPITGLVNGVGRLNIDTVNGKPQHLIAVSCPSATLCVAADDVGNLIGFDPSAGVTSFTTSVSASFAAISCLPVAGGADCAAVTTDGHEWLLTDSSGAITTSSGLIDGTTALTAVACTSLTSCVAVDGSGNEIAFTPGASPNPASSQIDTTTFNKTITPVAINDVACQATTCVAVDAIGNAVSFTPGVAPAATITSIDGTRNIDAVSCPVSGNCAAVDNRGDEVAFAADGSSVAQPHALIASVLDGIACPSRTQCTAITHGRTEITFDPTTGQINAAGTVALDSTGNPLQAISCLSTTECVAVDSGGFEFTFDPTNGGLIANGEVQLDNASLDALACLSVSGTPQCTTVDNVGNEVTFNPSTSQINNVGLTPIDNGGYALEGVSCPTQALCVAVDNQGNEVSFNPDDTTGSVFIGPVNGVAVDGGHRLNAIACPSATQCTAIDADGGLVTFTPGANTTIPNRQTIEVSAISLNAITCPTASQCTLVDALGNEATFSPTATSLSPGLLVPLVGANSLRAVACLDSSICATVDQEGNGFAGVVVPSNTALPTISSGHQEHVQVTETNGTWTNSPTSFAYQWEDCTSQTDASTCSPISGATGQSYTPVASDIGDYLRVQETASNEVLSSTPGSPTSLPGAPVLSAASAQITPSPAVNNGPPTISSPSSLYQEDQQLVETNGLWIEDSKTPLVYSYQWQDCDSTGNNCSSIAGATKQTYTPTDSDVGHTIRVLEVADNGGLPVPSATASATTPVIEPAPPENRAAPATGPSGPTISGKAQEGQTLTEVHAVWTNTTASTKYTYQWEDCTSAGSDCTAIPGATLQTYTPTAADVGSRLVVVETVDNGGKPQPAPVSSSPSAVVLPAAPTSVSPPTIAGTVQQGETLTEGHGIWRSGVDAPTGYSYQWEACTATGANCAPIAGATQPTYTPSTGDVGHALVVLETASNSGGSTGPIASVPTAPASAAPPPAIQAESRRATARHTTEVTLNATLTTQGLGVTWQFVYGRTTRYTGGTAVVTVPAGGPASITVSRRLTGLSPGTTYHFRIVESAPVGTYSPAATAYGQDLTFTTGSAGKIVLRSTRLAVTPSGHVLVLLKCASELACDARFSIDTSTEIGRGRSRHRAEVLCTTAVARIRAGRQKVEQASLTSGCRALLQAASGTLSAKFTSRPRSGQLGVIKPVRLVAGTLKHRRRTVRRHT